MFTDDLNKRRAFENMYAIRWEKEVFSDVR